MAKKNSPTETQKHKTADGTEVPAPLTVESFATLDDDQIKSLLEGNTDKVQAIEGFKVPESRDEAVSLLLRAGIQPPTGDAEASDESDDEGAGAQPVNLNRSVADLENEYKALSEAVTRIVKDRPARAKEIAKRVETELGDFDGDLIVMRQRKRDAFNRWQAALQHEGDKTSLKREQDEIDRVQAENTKRAKQNADRQTELAKAEFDRLRNAPGK